MVMGFAPTWLRQVSPLVHMTTLTTVGAHPASDLLNAATKLATERCGVVRMTATVDFVCHQHTGTPTDHGAR